MTQQNFKFGDMVRIRANGEIGIVVDVDNFHVAKVLNEFGGDELYRFDDLEFVPHPDTIRLNRLAEDIRNRDVLLIGLDLEEYTDIREAIDVVLQEEGVEMPSV